LENRTLGDAFRAGLIAAEAERRRKILAVPAPPPNKLAKSCPVKTDTLDENQPQQAAGKKYKCASSYINFALNEIFPRTLIAFIFLLIFAYAIFKNIYDFYYFVGNPFRFVINGIFNG
jgi:hypothetical protein